MIEKLYAALKGLISDVSALTERMDSFEATPPVHGDPGEPGKDGTSPNIDDVVALVVEQLPEPEKVNTDELVGKVLSCMPPPKHGRDAEPVNVSDVAAIVLSKMPPPEKGDPGISPDPEAIARKVKAQVRNGDKGDPGPEGPPGPRGVSVTDVQLNNNELFVFLDGVKKTVGKLKIPVPTAPFSPGNNVGGGGRGRPGRDASPREVEFVTEDTTLQSLKIYLVDPTANDVILTLPAGETGEVTVKRVSGGPNDVTIIPDAGTIDGEANKTIVNLNTSLDFIKHESNWYIT